MYGVAYVNIGYNMYMSYSDGKRYMREQLGSFPEQINLYCVMPLGPQKLEPVFLFSFSPSLGRCPMHSHLTL